ncbi:MAG TPA: T9SS type A sorting domain-containing protein [Candidatus Eisenbacteria bacterium]|nr:T9SS type A sorting domain-containing protein [Candidatus Eisenbacteria bacterium]
MRNAASDAMAGLKRGLIALGLVATTASGASAQLLIDGTIFYENNASGTLVGQFSGTSAGPACAGLTASTLFGTTYPHNSYQNPLLSAAVYQPNVKPNWQPAPGSPAFGNAVVVPNDGFFKQTCYKGAIGGSPGMDDWTLGWTYYDSTGANRTDIDYTKPLAIYNNISILGHRTWSPDSNYEVRGSLRIRSQASLSIPPGVVILEDVATLGTIIVHRGGSIHAIGTREAPIVITSNAGNGNMQRGDIGGIALLGRARTNVVNSCLGDSAQSEGGAIGHYGGNDDTDGSGCLRYVRVEFAGRQITPNNELNSFTWNACGRSTRADFLESFQSADDGFELFGGDMRLTHLLAVDGTDDGFDTQLGARAKAQFVIVRIDPRLAPAGTQFGERGLEADNNEFNFNETQCAGRSAIQVANFTLIGDKRRGPGFGATAAAQGAEMRRGTAYSVYNSIVYNFNGFGARVSDQATWDAHCAAPPAAPAVFCPGAVGIESPISGGNVFVARSAPNPFRDKVTFSFSLPQSGPVSVEIYSADGRHIQTVAKGQMAAGPHTVSWSMDRETPSGMYFYRVLAGDQQTTGKITRVD